MLRIAALVFIASIVFAIVCATIRLFRGPKLADRVIVLDVLASFGIGIVALYTLATDDAAVFDIALIVALLSFVGTIAFGYYLERFR